MTATHDVVVSEESEVQAGVTSDKSPVVILPLYCCHIYVDGRVYVTCMCTVSILHLSTIIMHTIYLACQRGMRKIVRDMANARCPFGKNTL